MRIAMVAALVAVNLFAAPAVTAQVISVPDPTLDENIEIPSGRGIMLMRAYMSEISYKDPGNRVIMVFERRDP